MVKSLNSQVKKHLQRNRPKLSLPIDLCMHVHISIRYSERVKQLSKLAKDRPLSALDTAVYWTEYVLRHDDVSHLKSPGISQTWWERRLLLVWAGVFSLILIVASLLITILYAVLRFILGRKTGSASTQQRVQKKTQ
jgi:UDP-glucoronosyl and UDP-glucosyl transferase